MIDRLVYVLPKESHASKDIFETLNAHPEIRFVSLVGFDMGGHDTDEKIPVELFKKDIKKLLEKGVQTDGSSVVLPAISSLNDARVDIIPDLSVNWFVDYNYEYLTEDSKLPVGTLRIPAYLVHNDVRKVGSREILAGAVSYFSDQVRALLDAHPYVCEDLGIKSSADVKEVILTGATELEFWVKTPESTGDREQLHTSQELKEQYWQRTRGSVRSALEKTIYMLDKYGFGVEMGHKEVGGIKAKLDASGNYSHIMEQLEIDWAYDGALQAADNEAFIKYLVKDIFRMYNLEVTFMAKPIPGVAGSGKHTHLGAALKLKNGKIRNLFAPKDPRKDFLNPFGFGALMGLLKNYEVINPFVAASIDALNRLKPGFEAPVCIVTSLGHTASVPTRNRTVLAGLVRDIENPLATRFELRAPCPKSNTYLVMAAAFLAMLDGITAAVSAEKSATQLEKAISKKKGAQAFYLEKDRAYRSEEDVFEAYSAEERAELFGAPPRTVRENISAFGKYPDKYNVLKAGGVFDDLLLSSYEQAVTGQWKTELSNRVLPEAQDLVRGCVRLHSEEAATDLDLQLWREIDDLRNYIAKDTLESKCLLTRLKQKLAGGALDEASELEVELQKDIRLLEETYIEYKKNIL